MISENFSWAQMFFKVRVVCCGKKTCLKRFMASASPVTRPWDARFEFRAVRSTIDTLLSLKAPAREAVTEGAIGLCSTNSMPPAPQNSPLNCAQPVPFEAAGLLSWFWGISRTGQSLIRSLSGSDAPVHLKCNLLFQTMIFFILYCPCFRDSVTRRGYRISKIHPLKQSICYFWDENSVIFEMKLNEKRSCFHH